MSAVLWWRSQVSHQLAVNSSVFSRLLKGSAWTPQITADHRTPSRALTLTLTPNPNPNPNPNQTWTVHLHAVFRQTVLKVRKASAERVLWLLGTRQTLAHVLTQTACMQQALREDAALDLFDFWAKATRYVSCLVPSWWGKYKLSI